MQKVFAEVGQSLQQIGGDCPDGWIEMSEPRPHSDYVASADGNWTPPPYVYPKIYGNDKLNLFTQEEQIAIVTATMTDPLVKLTYDRLINATYLTYEDPEMERGLSLLVVKELLTMERKEQIITAMTGGTG